MSASAPASTTPNDKIAATPPSPDQPVGENTPKSGAVVGPAKMLLPKPRPKKHEGNKGSLSHSNAKGSHDALERVNSSASTIAAHSVGDDDAYAAYDQGTVDDIDAYFVDDNPLAFLRGGAGGGGGGVGGGVGVNVGGSGAASSSCGAKTFSGELGDRLNLLMSDSVEDLSGARLRLKLMELYKRKRDVDVAALEPADATWFRTYVAQQEQTALGRGGGGEEAKNGEQKQQQQDEGGSEEDLKALLETTRRQLAEYKAKCAQLQAERAGQGDMADDTDGDGGWQKVSVSPESTAAAAVSSSMSSASAAASTAQLSIHEAALNADKRAVETILLTFRKAGRSVDNEGRTALHIASKFGHLRIVKLLLEYAAEINAQDAEGQTALHLASNAAMARLLCEHGADSAVVDNHGFTPLHIHVMLMKADVVDALMAQGADPRVAEPARRRNVLHMAAATGNFAVFSTVVTQAQVPLPLDEQDGDGNSCLHLLAMNRHERRTAMGPDLPPSVSLQKCLMLMVDRGAATNLRNHRGSAALHYLCANRSLRANSAVPPFVDILLEMDADPNARDVEDCTPLMISAVHGDWESCTLLVSRGADINVPCRMSAHHLLDPSGTLGSGKGYVDDPLSPPQRFTASDLFPKGDRDLLLKLFSAVSARQSRVLRRRRWQCMECGYCFANAATAASEPDGDDSGADGMDCTGCAGGDTTGGKTSVVDSIVTFFTGGSSPSPDVRKVTSMLKSATASVGHLGQHVKKLTVAALAPDMSTVTPPPAELQLPVPMVPAADALEAAVAMGNCDHCGRLLCADCLPATLLRALLPTFMQGHVAVPESATLCSICRDVLVKP